MTFGINLSFTVKRWVEPGVWAKIVRETLGLDLVQFTYDLLDPWWPDDVRRSMAADVRKAAADWGIQIESAFSGLAGLTGGLPRLLRSLSGGISSGLGVGGGLVGSWSRRRRRSCRACRFLLRAGRQQQRGNNSAKSKFGIHRSVPRMKQELCW